MLLLFSKPWEPWGSLKLCHPASDLAQSCQTRAAPLCQNTGKLWQPPTSFFRAFTLKLLPRTPHFLALHPNLSFPSFHQLCLLRSRMARPIVGSPEARAGFNLQCPSIFACESLLNACICYEQYSSEVEIQTRLWPPEVQPFLDIRQLVADMSFLFILVLEKGRGIDKMCWVFVCICVYTCMCLHM